jgi:hypothetical protein
LIFPGRRIINNNVEKVIILRNFLSLFLFLSVFLPLYLTGLTGLAAQEAAEAGDTEPRTVPEFLRQPQRGEAPRYPTDMLIGSLEQKDVPDAAYAFARDVLEALLMENKEAAVLAPMNSADREKIFSDLGKINPRKFRLGTGREEADGSVSFLVRFIGRERGIAGELYLRSPVPAGGEPGETVQDQEGEPWQFDELILEEDRSLDEAAEDPLFDFPPYQRFF